MAYFNFNLKGLKAIFQRNMVEPVPANDVRYAYHLIRLDPFAITPMKITFQNDHPRKVEIPGKNISESFSIYHELESHHSQDTWPEISELQYKMALKRNHLRILPLEFGQAI